MNLRPSNAALVESAANVKCAACNHPLKPGETVCPSCSTPVPNAVKVSSAHPDNPLGVPNTSLSQRSASKSVDREEKTVLPLRVNDVLSGRYRLEAKIGEGGMGTVYTGHDNELDRQVAVKLLASNLVNDPEVVQRFEREARLTAKLDHPNIVPIYDVGQHEGRPFIVMKLLEGDTLAGALRSKGGLTGDETLALMKQIGAGLDYIHAKGFIHRDIKAGNIFIAANGLATILDFGILRARDASKGLTRTGMVMGTPHYMAPEQALGLKDVDHRVDLYALAVVLFECLTGTLPFEADSELRLIQLQAHAPPPEILDRAPWISKPVADVVRRALAKKPEDRFSSSAELVGALEAAFQASKGAPVGGPVKSKGAAVSQPTSLSLRKAGLARRRRWPVVLGGVVVMLAALIGWFKPWVAADGGGGWPMVVTAALDAGEDGDDSDGGFELFAAAMNDAGAGFDEDDYDDAGMMVTTSELLDAGRRLGPKRKGHLSVLSSRLGEPYWATVLVDGVHKGRTPVSLDLPAGRYVIRVERAGFRNQEREVRIASGKSTTLRVDLVP